MSYNTADCCILESLQNQYSCPENLSQIFEHKTKLKNLEYCKKFLNTEI